MTVTRIHEDPRVTKPYDEAQWLAVDALGQKIDAELQSGDVRLTQGGEPTFVSVDDMDGAEWNTAALSDKKWELAEQLAWRLKERFAEGGLVFYGQGKWYPGEPLPRWALGIQWRNDGEKLWRNPELIGAASTAADAKPAEKPKSSQAGELLGLGISELTDAQKTELKLKGGVRVEAASDATARAGLREGDVILAVAGRPVATLAEFYSRLWAQGPAGATIPLRLLREHDSFEVEIRSMDRATLLQELQVDIGERRRAEQELQLAELAAKYEGIDPEAVRTVLSSPPYAFTSL